MLEINISVWLPYHSNLDSTPSLYERCSLFADWIKFLPHRANEILIQNISGFQIPYKFQSFPFFFFWFVLFFISLAKLFSFHLFVEAHSLSFQKIKICFAFENMSKKFDWTWTCLNERIPVSFPCLFFWLSVVSTLSANHWPSKFCDCILSLCLPWSGSFSATCINLREKNLIYSCYNGKNKWRHHYKFQYFIFVQKLVLQLLIL